MRVQHYGQFIRLLLGCLVILSLVPAISQTTEQAQPTAGTAGQPTATTGTAAPAAPPATGTAGQAAPATGTAEPTPAVTPAETSHRGIWDTGTTLGTSSMDLTNGQPVDYEKTLVSIAFAKADITNVLSFLSMTSGVPVVVDADVKGTVTIISMKRVSLTMAYQVINSALRVRGYTMIGTLKDKLIRVVTLKRAVSDHADVREGADPQNVGTSDNVVTQVVQLQNASASKLKDELKPLVADDQANLLAVTSSNMLIVTDTEGNVKRLLQIINLLDKDPNDVLDVEIYQCKFASASILTASLSKIFPITTSNTAAQGQNGQQPGQPQPGGRQGGNGASGPSVRTDDGVYSMKGEFRVAADDRTNSLIISASRQKINMVLAMVKKLDVDTTPAVKARIFPLKYADATLVATQLTKLFDSSSSSSSGNPFFRQFQPNASASTTSDGFIGFKQNTVVADVRTNSVVITATETNMREFEKMLTQLDTPNKLSDITRAFPLKFASASTLATTLTALFRGTTTSSRTSFADLFYGNNTQNQAGDPIATLKNITVVAETKSNTLLITGPPQSFSMVESIINGLDQRSVQVFIEVAIVDVTLDDSTKFGVEWNLGSSNNGSIGTDFGLTKDTSGGLSYNVISNNLKALLKALSTKSNVKVYSTPSITTADNVQAKISIGQDIPYVSTSEDTTNGNPRFTVAYKNVSIALTVTPHVNGARNLITLDVEQTINEQVGEVTALNSPIIANRSAKTTVMVDDNATMVIGGIIKENKTREYSAVPVISKVPIIGNLFKSQTWRTQKSELMVFLTPHILRDRQEVENATDSAKSALAEPVPAPMMKGNTIVVPISVPVTPGK